jgi:hypothetical protein
MQKQEITIDIVEDTIYRRRIGRRSLWFEFEFELYKFCRGIELWVGAVVVTASQCS